MTAMIQEVSPIEREFLIRSIVQAEKPVRFHGVSTTGTGLITTMDRNRISVKLLDTFDGLPFTLFERLTGYFDCNGRTYAFDTTVRELKQTQISLDCPERLLKSLQRKYVRIKSPKSISVGFALANEDIKLDYPICPEYVSFEDERLFSPSKGINLTEFIGGFKERVKDKATLNTIVMFRTQKPVSFEEQLLSKTGKVLYIPSTLSGLPKNDPYPEGRIITESIEESFEAPDYFVTGSHFEKLLAEKKRAGISSEIWCPILYYQYVVGYVYLANNQDVPFDISMIDYVWDFSRLLAFQLKQTGYFKHEIQQNTAVIHSPRVVDMSPGGMLLSMPKNEIRTPVKEGSIFNVTVTCPDDTFSCNAKVLRRYEDKNTFMYGLTFINLSPDHVMNLYERLYRHPYSPDDPRAHEIKPSFSLNSPLSAKGSKI